MSAALRSGRADGRGGCWTGGWPSARLQRSGRKRADERSAAGGRAGGVLDRWVAVSQAAAIREEAGR